MKTVKEVCLGMAVAGMVVGAGSTIGCAVASATPDADTGNAVEASAGRADRSAGPARGDDRPGARGQKSRAAATSDSAPSPSASVRNNRAARQPAVAVTAPLGTVGTAGTDDVADRIVTVDAPQPAAEAQGPAPQSAPAAEAAAPRPVASVRVTRVAVSAAALTPAPASPLNPVAPLPIPFSPFVPVAPAGTVSSASSTTSPRSRQAASSVTALQIGDPSATHVLLIGTDGTNLSKILEYAYTDGSGFKVIMDEAITGATSIVGHTTISGPSWSTILTGVWDNKTGVINNLFNPAPYTPWPTVFNQLESYDSAIDTAVIADWKYINDIGAAGSFPVAADDNVFIEFVNSWEDTDDLVADETIERILNTSAGTSTFMFSYQVAVDEAGHAFGGGSEEYRDAVINTSENIARIMDAVEAWETSTGETWTVIVTTDHGHQQSVGFGHGFQSPNETSSFVMYRDGEPGDDGVQNLGYQNTDITPTIVKLFGAPERGDFDGVPLGDKSTGIVDPVDLKQALNDAINFAGYPNIGTDIALGARTIFASIPYFLNGFVESITGQLQGIVDQDIFLLSGLAGVTEFLVQITGDVLVAATQAIARVVAYLTGSGTIAPTTPPLPVPPANSEFVGGQLVLT